MPPSAQNLELPPTRPRFSCNQCHRSFNRPSHLNRHHLTHLPPSSRKTIPCVYCDQSFSRKDVLLRHLRGTHSIDVQTNACQQKSCNRCVRRKLRCNRAVPCNSCVEGNTPEFCSYPSAEQIYNAGSQVHHQNHDQPVIWNSVSEPRLSQPDLCRLTAESPETSSTISQSLDPLILDSDDMSPIFTEDHTISSGNAIFRSPLDNEIKIDFRCSGFDWLDFDMPDTEFNTRFAGIDTRFLAPVSMMSVPTTEDAALALPQIRPNGPGLPWPFEQGQESASTRYPLPSLHEVLQRTAQQIPGDKSPALEGLGQILSEQRLPRPGDVTSSKISMGIDLLRRLVDAYFTGFQLIQPIFHRATWRMAECPTILLATMACLGAVLSNEPNSTELSSSISELCSPIISWMGVADAANYSDIFYLGSLCLHQIYSLGSGNRQLYQNADRTRGVLFGSLRGLGMLKSRPNVQQDAELSTFISTDMASLEVQWRRWASKEEGSRVAWASFEYDCSLCTLTGRRGAIDLSELPPHLPCIESLWEAPSANAWAALKYRLAPSALGISVSTVISSAIAGAPLPEHVSTWGKRLCGQAMGRLLWDLKQLQLVSTMEYFGLPVLSSAQNQSKELLLQALDYLLETMDHPISATDLVSYNITSLLCHYSHLYTAGEIMDIILYIVQSVVSQGSDQHKGVDLARHRLSSTLADDPERARMLAWHAGQTIAVANEYLVSAPCEIMRIFMSYIFIVAFVQHYPRSQAVKNGIKVRLDILNQQADQKRSVERWIQNGGPARIGAAEDILAEDSIRIIVQDAQLMLQKLRSWGLADKFSKILVSFGSNGNQHRNVC